jgi:hypothetical protein
MTKGTLYSKYMFIILDVEKIPTDKNRHGRLSILQPKNRIVHSRNSALLVPNRTLIIPEAEFMKVQFL